MYSAVSEPQYIKPLYNKILGITNNFLYPSNSKIYGKEPCLQQKLIIANRFYQSLGPWLYQGSTLWCSDIKVHCTVHPWIMLKISIFNFRPRLPRKVLNQQRKRKQVGQLKRNPRKKSLKKRYKHFYYA